MRKKENKNKMLLITSIFIAAMFICLSASAAIARDPRVISADSYDIDELTDEEKAKIKEKLEAEAEQDNVLEAVSDEDDSSEIHEEDEAPDEVSGEIVPPPEPPIPPADDTSISEEEQEKKEASSISEAVSEEESDCPLCALSEESGTTEMTVIDSKVSQLQSFLEGLSEEELSILNSAIESLDIESVADYYSDLSTLEKMGANSFIAFQSNGLSSTLFSEQSSIESYSSIISAVESQNGVLDSAIGAGANGQLSWGGSSPISGAIPMSGAMMPVGEVGSTTSGSGTATTGISEECTDTCEASKEAAEESCNSAYENSVVALEANFPVISGLVDTFDLGPFVTLWAINQVGGLLGGLGYAIMADNFLSLLSDLGDILSNCLSNAWDAFQDCIDGGCGDDSNSAASSTASVAATSAMTNAMTTNTAMQTSVQTNSMQTSVQTNSMQTSVQTNSMQTGTTQESGSLSL